MSSLVSPLAHRGEGLILWRIVNAQKPMMMPNSSFHKILATSACLLTFPVGLARADLNVVSTSAKNSSIPKPETLPGTGTVTFESISVQGGDAIIFAYSNNKKASHVSATVELTAAGDPGSIVAVFDHIESFNGLPDDNDSGGIFWANMLAPGTFDVVVTYLFSETASGNASTGSGIVLMRADSGEIELHASTTADASGLNSQDLILAYSALPAGGVLVEAVTSNDDMTANAGGSTIYSTGSSDRRSGWQTPEPTGGDITNTYTIDFGDTSDTASAAGAYFVEIIGSSTFTIADGQTGTISPIVSTLGLEWSTVAAGADSVSITSDDPSVTPPATPTLSGSGDAALNYATMPATVTLTLNVWDDGPAVIDTKTIILSKWEFTARNTDFEDLTPNPGVPVIDPDEIDGLLSKGTGAEVVAVTGTGSTGLVGARFLDDSLTESNLTRFENLLTASDNDASAFVFRWVVKIDAGKQATLRLGTSNLSSRATRSTYLLSTKLLPTGDGAYHVVELVMNNTSSTLLYDHGNETGLKIGPRKIHILIDGEFLTGLSISGYPGPDFVDSAGFVTFKGGTMDVTIDEFSLTTLNASVTTSITGAEFSDVFEETVSGGSDFVFNFNYPAGPVDVYRSTSLTNWDFAPGGEHFIGGAYLVSDYVANGTPYFYLAVPQGEAAPSPDE